jgi:hypothetical protein
MRAFAEMNATCLAPHVTQLGGKHVCPPENKDSFISKRIGNFS